MKKILLTSTLLISFLPFVTVKAQDPLFDFIISNTDVSSKYEVPILMQILSNFSELYWISFDFQENEFEFVDKQVATSAEDIEKVTNYFNELISTLSEQTGETYSLKILAKNDTDKVLVRIENNQVIDNVFVDTNSENQSINKMNSSNQVTREQANALSSAENYLNLMPFSKGSLYDQLIYEGYPEEAAQYAVDNLNVNWKEQAAKTAKNYLELMSFSDSGLYDQLIYEQFTPEEAQFAIDQLD